MSEPLIRMQNVRKSYGRIQALEDATLAVGEREIVGLLGDNGAGKSTLIKVLSGAVPLSGGEIFIRGRKVAIRSTTDAIALGIETIYQDSALVTQLSIARNLFLGREPLRRPRFLNRMDHAAMEAVARSLLKQVGISGASLQQVESEMARFGEHHFVTLPHPPHMEAMFQHA